MIDHGPQEYDALDDYPSFCINAAKAVAAERAAGKDSLGIVLGGSGNGEQMVVNKVARSEEHTSELQSRGHLVCRLLLEKKKKTTDTSYTPVEHHNRARHFQKTI